jgi:mono/diheme cytochrome c family protein
MRALPLGLLVLCFFGAGYGCGDTKLAGGVVDGPRIYNDACARCHGPEGVPTPGLAARTGVKPLNTERVQKLSDQRLGEQIREGSSNKLMPAFQGALSDEQIAALIAHIRSLGPNGAPNPADSVVEDSATP